VTFTAGVLSGTPTASGTFPITFTASNGVSPNGTQSFTLTVQQAPTFTSTNSATFTEGQLGSCTVTATGMPTPTITESGTLPTGVTFTAGVLGGTPSTSGTFPITFTASNGVSPNGIQSFTLTVQQTPAITSANGATFTEGQLGSFTVTATGMPTPTITESGTLPTGVTFTAGVLSGTPTTSGTFPITFTASNGVSPDATQSFSLTMIPAAFFNASLDGQYAFSFTDSLGQVFTAGSFVADGNGGLSQGVLDFISNQNTQNVFNSGNSGMATNVDFTGSYEIGTDGRGTLTLASSLPSGELPTSYEFVMISSAEGRIISSNVVCVSGALFKQDTSAFTNAAIAGNYAFRQTGEQICGAGGACLMPWNAAGYFTMDGNGSISTGTTYYDNSGSGVGSSNIAGTYSIGLNGRGTMAYQSPSFPNQTLYTYVISANKMIFVSIGPSDGSILTNGGMAYIGEADQQIGLPFSTSSVSGNYTFALSTGLAGYEQSLAGQFNTTSESISGEEDSIDEQPVITTDVPFTGMTSSVSTSGFGTMNLSGGSVPYFMFYLASPGQAFLVSRDSASNGSVGGEANAQGNGPFTISGNYAFSFAGYSGLSKVDNLEAPVAASGQFIVDGAGNIQSGTIDLGNFGQDYPLTGTYSAIDSTGRSTATITTEIEGSQVSFDFIFYVNSSSEIALVGVNANVVGSAKRQ